MDATSWRRRPQSLAPLFAETWLPRLPEGNAVRHALDDSSEWRLGRRRPLKFDRDGGITRRTPDQIDFAPTGVGVRIAEHHLIGDHAPTDIGHEVDVRLVAPLGPNSSFPPRFRTSG